MDIYKEHLIEALETEPLHFGRWYGDKHGPTVWNGAPIGNTNILLPRHLRDNPDCRVCAVGSVFRKFSTREEIVCDLIDSQTDGRAHPYESEEIRNDGPRNWMTAISYVWESIGECNLDIDIDEARTHMIDWVETNVPDDEILFHV